MNYMQSQSALVAEMSLSGRMTECLLRSYCLVGAHSTRSGDIAQVFSCFYNILKLEMEKIASNFSIVETIKKNFYVKIDFWKLVICPILLYKDVCFFCL